MINTRMGAFIALLRKEHSLTQERLAELLGVSNRSVSRWENGNTLPDFSLLESISSVLNVSIAELLAGERLTTDSRAEDCVRLALELAQREKEELRRSLNRCFGFGLLLLFCGTSLGGFAKAPLPFFLLCTILSLGCIVAGFYLNNKNPAPINESILTVADSRQCLKTAEEMLQFSEKYQTGHKAQQRLAFMELEKALREDEFAIFTFIGNSCTIDRAPGPWHVSVAVTQKRILISGETMHGRLLTLYPVEAYDRAQLKDLAYTPGKLTLQFERHITIDGSQMELVAEKLRSIL